MRNLLIIIVLTFSIFTCADKRASHLKTDLSSLPFNVKIYDILKPFNRTNIICFVPNNYKDSRTLINNIPDSVKIFCSGNILDCEKIEPSSNVDFKYSIPVYYYVCINQVKDLSKCQTISFELRKSHYNLPFALDTISGNFVSIPSITGFGDSLIFCSIDLIRVHPSEEEYFPTSERLRVEVLNSMGKSLWRSDDGVYFLQVTGKVEPEKVGEIHRYSLSIPNEITSKIANKLDKFTFRLSLPIKPKPIVYDLDFQSR